MLRRFRGFLFSTALVGAGLAGIWAWPGVEAGLGGGDGNGLVARAVRALQAAAPNLQVATPAHGALSPDAGRKVDGRAADKAVSKAEIKPLRVAAKAPVASGCDGPDSALDAVVIGDKLQLRIFETTALASGAGTGNAAPSDVIFERLDLSGTYEVGPTGAISLPAIGHVEVVGQSLSCVETLTAEAAFKRLKTASTVSAGFAGRPGILIHGAVRAPGSYTYNPGLTVEHLLAQAGAIEAQDAASVVRLTTLESRRNELERARAGLDLERMRLNAALAGSESLFDDANLLARAEALLGAGRVETERAALAADIDAERMRRTRGAEHLSDLDARIETARHQYDGAKEQFAYFDSRREQQAGLLKNGTITEIRAEGTTIKAMEANQALLEKQEALLRLQAERRLAANDAALADAERESALTAELRTLAARSDSLESEYQTVVAEIEAMGGGDSGYAVTIERPSGMDEARTITAEAGTLVLPGDFVTVSRDAGKVKKSASLEAPAQPFVVRSASSK